MRIEIDKTYIEEYLEKVENLQANIVNAYYNYFYLIAIKDLNLKPIWPIDRQCKDAIVCLKTIVLSLQKDFLLIIWKIFLDPNIKANTIYNLKNSLNKNYITSQHLKIKNIKDTSFKKEIKDLKDLRKTFLAHSDLKSEPIKLNLEALKNVLDLILDFYNSLLFDEAIKFKLNHEEISKYKDSCQYGLKLLFNGQLYKITRNEY